MSRHDVWQVARLIAKRHGHLLRQARTEAHMTMVDLCDAVGIDRDPPFISRVEAGTTIPPEPIGELLTAWMYSQDRLQLAQGVTISDEAVVYQIGTPTPPRATHPDTSRQAAISVNRDTARKVHHWIIGALTDHDDGLTHEQLWDLFSSVYTGPAWPEVKATQSGLRTRVSELVRGRVVMDSGRRRAMRSGRQAIVWTLTTNEGNTDG